jgi:OPA family sugar phosphate sensor protein UhpC-like MFS transporter
VNGEMAYTFESISTFWIGAAVISVVLALFVWKKT